MTKLLLVLVGAATLALAADPFPGSWKLDLEKSKLSPSGLDRRKGEVLTIESAGKDKYQVILSRPLGKTADTKPRIWIVDGREHEEQGPGDVVVTMKVERLSESHLRTTAKGGQSVVFDWNVAADGMVLVVTPGSKPDEFAVYNKQ